MGLDNQDYREPACLFDLSGVVPREAAACENPIDVRAVLDEFDACVGRNNVEKAKQVLDAWLAEARARGDKRGALTLCSEQMGFYRQLGDREKSLGAVEEGLRLLQEVAVRGVSAGTILINAATALCAFGKPEEALPYYAEAFRQYGASLPPEDIRFAGLCNNMAAAYAATGELRHAEAYYTKALQLLKAAGEKMDLAVTYINLAQLRFQENPEDTEVLDLMEEAWRCFEDPAVPRDGYYAHTAQKSIGAFRYFGYSQAVEELQKRMEKIYAGT